MRQHYNHLTIFFQVYVEQINQLVIHITGLLLENGRDNWDLTLICAALIQ